MKLDNIFFYDAPKKNKEDKITKRCNYTRLVVMHYKKCRQALNILKLFNER